MSYENWQIEKWKIWENPDADDQQIALDEYADVAAWCNESGQYTIIDDGEFYKVVKIPEPEPEPEQESPTDEEIAANME